MANEQFGFFDAEKQTLAITRNLRRSGLTLAQISNKLAALGFTNRRGATYSECSISRMLNHRGTLTHV